MSILNLSRRSSVKAGWPEQLQVSSLIRQRRRAGAFGRPIPHSVDPPARVCLDHRSRRQLAGEASGVLERPHLGNTVGA